MAFEYVNRCGDRYYVLQGKTKTGKPTYYASRKPNGVLLDRVPDGFEIYEHPERGLVTVRRIQASRVLPIERERLTRWTAELAGIEFFRVDVQKDSLVIYTPGTGPAELVDSFSRRLGGLSCSREAALASVAADATYSPMFRFTLSDEGKRLFRAERWCYRGFIDGWFPLSGGAPLEALAKAYLPHLVRESFFDLM